MATIKSIGEAAIHVCHPSFTDLYPFLLLVKTQSHSVILAGKQPSGSMQFNAPEGCPCTPQLLCQAADPGYFDAECNIPLHLVPAYSTRTYSMHGGAGALLPL